MFHFSFFTSIVYLQIPRSVGRAKYSCTHTHKRMITLKDAHAHSCTTQVCVHISPYPEGSYACDPSIPRDEEECEDEGIEGGGGVKVGSSYQHKGQLRKRKKKPSPCCAQVPLFCIISKCFEAFMPLIFSFLV